MSKNRITTGFPTIDNILGGLRSDDLVVIAGQQGIGKTSFVLNVLTKNFASNNICYLTLRDSEETIAERLYVLKESMGVKMSIVPFSVGVVSVTLENTECDGSSIIHLPSPKRLALFQCMTLQKYDCYIIDSLDWTGSKKKATKTLRYLKVLAEALNRPIVVLVSADKFIEPKNILTNREPENVLCNADLLLQLHRPGWEPMPLEDLEDYDEKTELDSFDMLYSPYEKKKTTVIVSRPNQELDEHVELTFFPKTGRFTESL
jgi:archaellum biogenesis ATPase FlaH